MLTEVNACHRFALEDRSVSEQESVLVRSGDHDRLNIPHKVADANTEGIRHDFKGFQRCVALSALKRSYLRSMQSAFVSKDILAPAFLLPVHSNSFTHENQNVLHQEQFAGNLLIRRLLISRLGADGS